MHDTTKEASLRLYSCHVDLSSGSAYTEKMLVDWPKRLPSTCTCIQHATCSLPLPNHLLWCPCPTNSHFQPVTPRLLPLSASFPSLTRYLSLCGNTDTIVHAHTECGRAEGAIWRYGDAPRPRPPRLLPGKGACGRPGALSTCASQI